jgi:hypothetical protein
MMYILANKILGALEESRKAPVSFVMLVRVSVCPSVFLHVSALLPLDDFPCNFILGTFKNICIGCRNLVKIRQKCRAFLYKDLSKFYFCGTALLVAGSRDRFPVVSVGIFSESTDGTMCPGVDSASKNEYQENSWG